MIPILYGEKERRFYRFGTMLVDVISCMVTESKEGEYELEMLYPLSGQGFDEIRLRKIILAKANEKYQSQPFRIYKITKPINGIVTVNARHVAYDLGGYPIGAVIRRTASVQDIVQALKTSVQNPFSMDVTGDYTGTYSFNFDRPYSIRHWMSGNTGSITDVVGGGWWEFDRFKCHFCKRDDAPISAMIRYAKNVSDFTHEENSEDRYSGIVAFFASDASVIWSSVHTVDSSFTNVLTVEASDISEVLGRDIQNPTVADLNEYCDVYLDKHDINSSTETMSLSYVDAGDTAEVEVLLTDNTLVMGEYSILTDNDDNDFLWSADISETIALHDMISWADRYGYSGLAECVSTTYNTVTERFEKIEIGDYKINIADTISDLIKKVK